MDARRSARFDTQKKAAPQAAEGSEASFGQGLDEIRRRRNRPWRATGAYLDENRRAGKGGAAAAWGYRRKAIGEGVFQVTHPFRPSSWDGGPQRLEIDSAARAQRFFWK
jgi:hypothetical protein